MPGLLVTRLLWSTLAFVALLAVAPRSYAQSGQGSGFGRTAPSGIHLDPSMHMAFGLEGYTGPSVMHQREGFIGQWGAGGLARGTISVVQFGYALESASGLRRGWESAVFFAGAWLPFTNWVDIEATAGFGSRRHENLDTRLGPNGAAVRSPMGMLRLGISDRSGAGLFGARVGAALITALDFQPKNVPWTYQVSETRSTGGTMGFGGFSATIVFNIGFDVLILRPRR
jgi:hypothetical protein